MAYKKITIKGKGKEEFSFVGIYVGKFERIGLNQLRLVDELRTSKGSQLKKSFQLWHTQRNQYYLKIKNQFSQWEVRVLNSVIELRKWVANDDMYESLARYAAKIHDLEPYAVPSLENFNKYKKQKVRSEKWRPDLVKNEDKKIDNDLFLGDHDYFTRNTKNDNDSSEALKKEIDMGDVSFYGFDEEMIKRFAVSAKNQIEEKKKIQDQLKNKN